MVQVTDCGNLTAAGGFVYGVRGDVLRYWSDDGPDALRIVVDLSPAAAGFLCQRETCAVQAEVLP